MERRRVQRAHCQLNAADVDTLDTHSAGFVAGGAGYRGTFALGTRRLYEFLDQNAALELWPCAT